MAVELFDKNDKKKIISKVNLFIIENIDQNVINVNHTVPNEVEEVLLVPLEQLNEKEVTVPNKKERTQFRTLPLSFKIQLAIRKIKKNISLYIF